MIPISYYIIPVYINIIPVSYYDTKIKNSHNMIQDKTIISIIINNNTNNTNII